MARATQPLARMTIISIMLFVWTLISTSVKFTPISSSVKLLLTIARHRVYGAGMQVLTVKQPAIIILGIQGLCFTMVEA
jgi:hypothetical protein